MEWKREGEISFQTRNDNVRAQGSGLGNCQVSCEEAKFYGAGHVPCNSDCARGEDCCVHFDTCKRGLAVKESVKKTASTWQHEHRVAASRSFSFGYTVALALGIGLIAVLWRATRPPGITPTLV